MWWWWWWWWFWVATGCGQDDIAAHFVRRRRGERRLRVVGRHATQRTGRRSATTHWLLPVRHRSLALWITFIHKDTPIHRHVQTRGASTNQSIDVDGSFSPLVRSFGDRQAQDSLFSCFTRCGCVSRRVSGNSMRCLKTWRAPSIWSFTVAFEFVSFSAEWLWGVSFSLFLLASIFQGIPESVLPVMVRTLLDRLTLTEFADRLVCVDWQWHWFRIQIAIFRLSVFATELPERTVEVTRENCRWQLRWLETRRLCFWCVVSSSFCFCADPSCDWLFFFSGRAVDWCWCYFTSIQYCFVFRFWVVFVILSFYFPVWDFISQSMKTRAVILTTHRYIRASWCLSFLSLFSIVRSSGWLCGASLCFSFQHGRSWSAVPTHRHFGDGSTPLFGLHPTLEALVWSGSSVGSVHRSRGAYVFGTVQIVTT